MRTSDVFMLLLAAAAITRLMTGCLTEDRCIRFSDCASGLTCADGYCIKVVDQDDASADADVDATTTVHDSGAAVKDASADAHHDASADASTIQDSGAASDTGAADQ